MAPVEDDMARSWEASFPKLGPFLGDAVCSIHVLQYNYQMCRNISNIILQYATQETSSSTPYFWNQARCIILAPFPLFDLSIEQIDAIIFIETLKNFACSTYVAYRAVL